MHEQQINQADLLSEWRTFLAANPDIEYIDAFVIDVSGHTSGKRIPSADAESLYRSGIQFSASCFVADCRGLGHDAGGLGKSDGDPDGTAKPIAGTLCRVPWSSVPTAQVLCHMTDVTEGKPLPVDPRVILSDVVSQCRAAGIHPVVACEIEFYLISQRRTDNGGIEVASLPGRSAARRAANLSLEAVDEAAVFLNRVMDAARAQGLPVSSVVAEYGVGQYEVNLRHLADPLLACDQSALLMRLIKGVARSMDMDATFMAKPFMDQPGNGLHIHVSIVDDQGRNRFGGMGGEVLLHQAIAGMQALLYDSFAIFAPNFNSQRRYLGSFVPTSRAWANNNRSVAFRVPVSHGEARRIEHRVAGSDAGPHLTMAAVLAGLLHGITHQLQATEPVDGRAAEGGDAEFPADLMVALNRMESSQFLTRYIPFAFLKIFADSKRGEYLDLIKDIFSQEYDFYV